MLTLPCKPFTKYVHKGLADFQRPPWVPPTNNFLEPGEPSPPRAPHQGNPGCDYNEKSFLNYKSYLFNSLRAWLNAGAYTGGAGAARLPPSRQTNARNFRGDIRIKDNVRG